MRITNKKRKREKLFCCIYIKFWARAPRKINSLRLYEPEMLQKDEPRYLDETQRNNTENKVKNIMALCIML